MPAQTLAQSLKNHTLHIPSLQSLFHSHSWPSLPPNQSYTHIAPLVTTTLLNLSSSRASIAKRLTDDLARFPSLWYPTAEAEQLQALALFTVWLICWDDEVDSNEGSLGANFEKAQALRNETLLVFKAAIGLGDDAILSRKLDPVNEVLLAFKECLSGPISQHLRQGIFEQVERFVACCQTEQEFRIRGEVPDYEGYMAFREGTVAGGILCSLIEYAQQICLPQSVVGSVEMMTLGKQVAIVAALLNDLLSFKKELKEDCVINAVASLLMSSPGRTLDDVVREIVERMEVAVEEFDTTAERLLAGIDEGERAVTESYINGCRQIVTGTLEFTWVSLYSFCS